MNWRDGLENVFIPEVNLRKFTESLWFYLGLGAVAFLMLSFAVKGWPADTDTERITKLECQVKQQREMIRYLYAQVYYSAGSKEGKLLEPKGLKKFMRGEK